MDTTTRESIILTRKALSKGRYVTITSKRGTFYRDPEKQLQDAMELQQAIADARAERVKHETA
jgi:hypothetical protein